MGYYGSCLKGYGRLDCAELQAKLQSEFAVGQWIALAIYTAGVACFKWDGRLCAPLDADENDKIDYAHLLELRVFDESSELHALRDAMGRPFSWRFIEDCESDVDFAACTITEDQYLDIDARRSNTAAGEYCGTGGGFYSLPAPDACKIRLRNYIDFDEENMARVVDFRIVKFLKEGEE